MPKEFHRTDRINLMIQHELAYLFRVQASDPRFSALSVTEVEVSRDLSYAKVYLASLIEDVAERQNLISALIKASGFLRTKLAEKIKLRKIPALIYKFDDSHSRGMHLRDVIKRAVDDDKDKYQE